MTVLLDLTLRPSLVIAVTLALCACLRHRSAALRHAVLTSGMLTAALVVPVMPMLPTWHVVLPQADGALPRVAASGRADSDTSTIALTPHAVIPAAIAPAHMIAAVWACGTAVGMLMLASGFVRLRRLTAQAEIVNIGRWPVLAREVASRYGISRAVVIRRSKAPQLLAAWGLWSPTVLLPPDALAWTDERARVVLAHELAHIRRADWPIQIAGEVFRIIFWFNPLFWIASRRLRTESERACDDEVLGLGVSGGDYAAHLFEIARGRRAMEKSVPAMSMAQPSTLEGRIAAMLNPQIDRRVPTRTAVTLTLVALVAILIPLAGLRIAAQAAPTTLTGFVYDTSGAVLPGVAVTLQDVQQQARQTTTDASGRFHFAPVSGGRYLLQASMPGFRSLRTDFELADAGDWQRAITLQVGEIEETVTVRTSRTSPPRTARTSGVVEAVRIGGNIKAPRKLTDMRPVYPDTMRDAGLEGVVPMEALIGQNGAVVSVNVLSAQVHPDFARAAQEAVRQWRFSPTLLNGVAVEVRMSVSVRFSLSD